MDSALLIQLLVSGLAIGLTYAVIGLGLSLIFGVLKLINFAHGESYMLGAYLVYTFTNLAGVHYVAAIVLSCLVCGILGWAISAVFVEKLVKTNEVAMLIGTLGMSYVILELALIIWGTDAQQTIVPWRGMTVGLPAGAQVPVQQVFTGVLAFIATIACVTLVRRSSYGRYMRAVAENPAAAGLCGINVSRVYRATFAVGSAIAALAGSSAGALTAVYPHVGQVIVLKAFVVVIVAGLGNVTGAIFAGILLGLVETLGGGLLTPDYQDAFGYILLVAVLLWRPDGLTLRRAT